MSRQNHPPCRSDNIRRQMKAYHQQVDFLRKLACIHFTHENRCNPSASAAALIDELEDTCPTEEKAP